MQLSVSVWFQRLRFNLAGETGNRASKFALSRSCCSLAKRGIEPPNSLFHDIAVRFDRVAARMFIMTIILVRGLHIAHVHELFWVSFHFMSFTKRQHARSLYRRSNPNPLVESLSPNPAVRLNLGKLSLYCNSHINNSVSVLILLES